jgi:hypothetical protein
MTLSVADLLEVYTLRQQMARDGVIKPSNEGRKLIDHLVSRLSEFDPSLPCSLEHEPTNTGKWTTFVVSGQVIARLWVPDSER